MKLIELLVERKKLEDGRMRLSFGSFMLPANATEKEREENRKFKDNLKRHGELCDRINEVFAKTRIDVPEYGNISLATAVRYAGDLYEIADITLASDYFTDKTSFLSWDNMNNDSVFGNPVFLPCASNNDESREKNEKVSDYRDSISLDLQVAIMKALVETTV